MVQMIDSLRIKKRGAPLYPMYFIAFSQQKLSEVRTILTGYPSNQSFFHLTFLLFISNRFISTFQGYCHRNVSLLPSTGIPTLDDLISTRIANQVHLDYFQRNDTGGLSDGDPYPNEFAQNSFHLV
jgi:hypothetical protein